MYINNNTQKKIQKNTRSDKKIQNIGSIDHFWVLKIVSGRDLELLQK